MPKQKRATVRLGKPISWLPVDSRILPPIFSFGHVRGMARVFLAVEMMLAALTVLGALILLILTLFP